MASMPSTLPARLEGLRIHLVGAKGTGVCALAELLVAAGARVSGSDVEDRFYTDEVLAAIGVPVRPFSAEAIDDSIDVVIHSAAYSPDSHVELVKARALGLTVLSYPEALGSLSAARDSSGIAGVHGKTTTTALAGMAAKALGLPTAVLVGSAVSSFGGRSTMTLGDELLIAETCEYRRHFLAFRPRRIVLTSVEPDHQDYYPDYESIVAGFVEYLSSLPRGGAVIYCADDPGAVDAWERARRARPDLRGVPYGVRAEGPFRLEAYEVREGRASFRLSGLPVALRLRVPGRHVALDAAAALALVATIVADREGGRGLRADELEALGRELEAFAGSSRRSELVGEAGGVIVVDDYAHHPTAIRATLAGFREFYPGRRIVLDFMSHTASRTKALLDDFAEALASVSLGSEGLVVLHRIYPSAREAPDPAMTGRVLFDKASLARGSALTRYFEEPLDALPFLLDELRPGDLFITMGAGDNFRLGRAVLAALLEREPARANDAKGNR